MKLALISHRLNYRRQQGSGSLGLLIMLPMILLVLVLMLDLGRQLLVRSLLAETVEEVTRRLMADKQLRASELAPAQQAQLIWQQLKQDQWLLASMQLDNLEALYFLDREQLLAENSSAWESENSCCARLEWQFNSQAAFSAIDNVASFGWNAFDFNFRRLLILPEDTLNNGGGN